MKAEFSDRIPSSSEQEKAAGDKRREQDTQWPFGKCPQANQGIEQVIPRRIDEKTPIEAVEQNQAQRNKKTERHVDTGAQRLICIHHGGRENGCADQGSFPAVKFASKKIENDHSESGIKRRGKPDCRFVERSGNFRGERSRPVKERRLRWNVSCSL